MTKCIVCNPELRQSCRAGNRRLLSPSANCLGCTTAMTDRNQKPASSAWHGNLRPRGKRLRIPSFSPTGGWEPRYNPPCVTIYTPDAHLRRECLLAMQTLQGT